MGRAQVITGISCDTNAAQGAAIILRARFEEMSAMREKALDFSTIDGVHDMRVSMRRLRNALRDLSPILKKKPFRAFNKDLKKLYDVVGAVRDEDVAIASLEKMRTETDSEIVRQGIHNLLGDHYKTRDKAREKLTAEFADGRVSKLEKELAALIDKGAGFKGSKRETTLNEIGAKAIGSIIKRFCKLSDNLYTAYDFEALHRFRIASKRLRTALELFAVCWDEDVAPFIDQVAKIQLLLGKVHDRDGWLTDLTARLSPNNKKVLIVDGLAAKWMSSRLVRKRNKNYAVALQLWKEWEADQFIEKLTEMISTKDDRVGEPEITGPAPKH
jgi:triphosphatase